MKHGLISFDRVLEVIQIPIKSEHAVQLVHHPVPEVNSLNQSLSFSRRILSLEFTPSSPAVLMQDQTMSTNIIVPSNPNPPISSSLNVCMMCVSNSTSVTSHEDPHLTMQTDFVEIRSLASRLIAAIHADEVEKKLLRFDEHLSFNLKTHLCIF